MLDKVPLTMRRAVLADCDAVLRLQAAADADLQVAQGLYSRVCNPLYAATQCYTSLPCMRPQSAGRRADLQQQAT